MIAIYKREMRAFFTSPSGYIYIAMFVAVSGFFFSMFTLLAGAGSSITSYFTAELMIAALMTPLLTMKSFSEERKQKTEQLLMTAPVTLPDVGIRVRLGVKGGVDLDLLQLRNFHVSFHAVTSS